MYITIRKYQSNNQEEVVTKIQEGFIPLISEMPGFEGYYVVPVDSDKIVVVSMFDSEINAEGSALLAQRWVEDTIAHLYSGPPEVLQGEAKIASED